MWVTEYSGALISAETYITSSIKKGKGEERHISLDIS